MSGRVEDLLGYAVFHKAQRYGQFVGEPVHSPMRVYKSEKQAWGRLKQSGFFTERYWIRPEDQNKIEDYLCLPVYLHGYYRDDTEPEEGQ